MCLARRKVNVIFRMLKDGTTYNDNHPHQQQAAYPTPLHHHKPIAQATTIGPKTMSRNPYPQPGANHPPYNLLTP